MLQIEKMLGGARRQSGGVLAEGEQDQEMSPQEQDTRGGSDRGKGQRCVEAVKFDAMNVIVRFYENFIAVLLKIHSIKNEGSNFEKCHAMKKS